MLENFYRRIYKISNDITGKQFGRLKAVKFIRNVKSKYIWLFRCSCGKEVELGRKSVVTGDTKSCGCLSIEKAKERFSVDITGKKFNQLTAIRFISKKSPTNYVWLFRCDCGKETIKNRCSVVSGVAKSCGCLLLNYQDLRGQIPRKYNRLSDEQVKSITRKWNLSRKPTKCISGYVRIFKPDHPFSNKSGYILEHRLVMELNIGRYLLPSENIHHRNGVRDDNRLENLELWQTHQPVGQRTEDLVNFAREILKTYGEMFPE